MTTGRPQGRPVVILTERGRPAPMKRRTQRAPGTVARARRGAKAKAKARAQKTAEGRSATAYARCLRTSPP